MSTANHAFDVLPSFNSLGKDPSPQTFSWSTAIAYLVLAVLSVYYALRYPEYPIHHMSGLAWDFLVYVTPSRVLSILDISADSTSVGTSEKDSRLSGTMGHARKSEALKRVMGLDGGGIMNKLQRAKGLSNIGTMMHANTDSTSSEKPPGLGNWDNSCYQNSVIQGLASLPALRVFLDKVSNPQEPLSTKDALYEVIAKLNNPANAGKLFWTPKQLKSMSSWQQQDAQEYLSKVLDEVEKDTAQTVKSSGRGGLSQVASLMLDPAASIYECKAGKSRFVNRCSPGGVPRLNQLPHELASVLARNPLEGLLAQRVGCLQCGFVEGLSLIPFNCLTVPLGRQWLYDVRTCLDDYTSLEHISGVECAKCTLLGNKKQMERLLSEPYDQDPGDSSPLAPRLTEALQDTVRERLSAVDEALSDNDFSDNAVSKKCQISTKNRVSTTKSRQAVIARPPKSLVIHINRSVFDENSGLQRKNLAEVRFPQQLDLAPWCLGSNASNKAGDVWLDSWSVDPSKSMLPPETNNQNLDSKAIYDLRAVITHYGRHENGHYVCYRKHWLPSQPSTESATKAAESWWRLSDDEVSQVSEEDVLAQAGVFMLFYEKTESLVVDEAPTGTLVGHDEAAAEEDASSVQKEPRVVETENVVTILHNGATSDIGPTIGELVPSGITQEAPGTKSTPPPTPPEVGSISKAEPPVEPIPTTSNTSSLITSKPTTFPAKPSSTITIPPSSSSPSMLPAPPTMSTPLNIMPAPHIPSSIPYLSDPAPINTTDTTTQELTDHCSSDPKLEPQKPLASPLMRTAGPRGSVSRANQALGTVGSMVEAN